MVVKKREYYEYLNNFYRRTYLIGSASVMKEIDMPDDCIRVVKHFMEYRGIPIQQGVLPFLWF